MNYYIILIIVAVALFCLGFIFSLLQKNTVDNLSDTMYSNTGSFSLTSEFDYQKEDNDDPVIIESTVLDEEV